MFGSKIKIDKDLLDRCERHAKDTGYSSVEEFVAHTLESELKKADPNPSQEEGEVLKRLKGLGYIE